MSSEKNIYAYPEGLEVITLSSCDSTNNYLKKHAVEWQDRFPVLVTADLQTCGKGRDQRNWVSTEGKGLYSSFGFFLERGGNLPFLPLAAGIAVIETLEILAGLEAGLKWPNDVLCEGKKIAGILIENVIHQERISCVAGIGINLNHSPADFPGELAEKAISIKMIRGSGYERDVVNRLLACRFFHWLERLDEPGAVVKRANRYSGFLRNREIGFHSAGKMIRGIFKGINDDGGLLLQEADGHTGLYYSGEIG